MLGSPTGLDASEDAVLLAGRAAIVAARGFTAAAGFATARGLGGATAARLNRTAARGLATAARFAARRSTAVLRGHAGFQAGEEAALFRTRVATARLAAAARFDAAAAWLGRATAAAHAPGMSVGRESQRHSDAQRRQQVTFHREAPENWWGEQRLRRGSPQPSRPRPCLGGMAPMR